jgi:hypothetical protein
MQTSPIASTDTRADNHLGRQESFSLEHCKRSSSTLLTETQWSGGNGDGLSLLALEGEGKEGGGGSRLSRGASACQSGADVCAYADIEKGGHTSGQNGAAVAAAALKADMRKRTRARWLVWGSKVLSLLALLVEMYNY